MPKIRATIVVEWEIVNLDDYRASTPAEAAENEMQNYRDEMIGVEDIVSFGETVNVSMEAVE